MSEMINRRWSQEEAFNDPPLGPLAACGLHRWHELEHSPEAQWSTYITYNIILQ